MLRELKKMVSKNQGLTVAVLIVAGLLVWTYGCESTVSSLVSPNKMVTRDELNLEIQQETQRLEAELDVLVKQAVLKNQRLDRQDAIKQKLFQFVALTAEAGTVNPAGVVGLLGFLVGAGAVVDNRIKDKVIKNRPLK